MFLLIWRHSACIFQLNTIWEIAMKICFGFVVKMELAVETEEDRFRHICSSVCHSSLTLQKPPLNFLPAQPWAPFDFLVLLISQKDPGPAKRVSISWLFRFCQSHTLPGNFRIKSQWHFLSATVPENNYFLSIGSKRRNILICCQGKDRQVFP